jgi:hypothetical protein
MNRESLKQLLITVVPSIFILMIMVMASAIFNIGCDRMSRTH